MKYSDLRAKGTPGEWRHDGTGFIIAGPEEEKDEVAKVLPIDRDRLGLQKSNAVLIPHEHNHLPKLLEALRRLERQVTEEHNDFRIGCSGDMGVALDDARTALKSAEEVKK